MYCSHKDHFFVHGIKEKLADLKVQTYENTAYGVFVNSIESYYRHNMNLLNEDNYRALFYKRPFIRTKIGNQPPTKYRTGANVKQSILGNGCQIDGDVEGSILFRGVTVEAGATIKNSIIMQRCKIEAGVYLENVILDKDVHVTANQKLIGSTEKPYVVAKSKVFVIDVQTMIKERSTMENVLFVASECTPFVKTGGLADVIGSLPQALQAHEKVDVRVILPLYDEIEEDWHDQMTYLTSFNVEFGWRNQEVRIYTLTHQNIMYYFVENAYYFTRKGIYGYYDDGERFVFFSHAVIEALHHLDFKPDILHAHDWQAGIAVALAKIKQPIADMKTVFTIHNIKYQGLMKLDTYADFFQLPDEHIGGMEWNGMLNCLKSALFHADKITTVSPTYAEEIKDPYFSEGLESILLERETDLVGILNGIDIKEYNPLTDPSRSCAFSFFKN